MNTEKRTTTRITKPQKPNIKSKNTSKHTQTLRTNKPTVKLSTQRRPHHSTHPPLVQVNTKSTITVSTNVDQFHRKRQ